MVTYKTCFKNCEPNMTNKTGVTKLRLWLISGATTTTTSIKTADQWVRGASMSSWNSWYIHVYIFPRSVHEYSLDHILLLPLQLQT